MRRPAVSLLAFYGAELRHARDAAGLTQGDIGARVGYSDKTVSAVENGRMTPSEDMSAALDRTLGTDGVFLRLWEMVDREKVVTAEFARYAEQERRATAILTYECYVVPGLLQTEDYARAVIEAYRPAMSRSEVETTLAARMTRQAILTRDDPPRLWAVVDESVLHRTVGGQGVMRDQLTALAGYRGDPHTVVQVLPHGAELSPTLGLSFLVAELADGAWTHHVDAQGMALRDDGSATRRYRDAYDHLRMSALSEARSADMIEAAVKEAT